MFWLVSKATAKKKKVPNQLYQGQLFANLGS
jgi:hypothetical protein